MEMFRSFRGDKHEFCLAIIKFMHVSSCPSIDCALNEATMNECKFIFFLFTPRLER